MGADASAYVGRTVFLRNDHGKHLQYNGSAFTSSPNALAWESWVVEAAVRDGSKVTHVYLSNPTFDIRLSAHENKKSISASKNREIWERWQLVPSGDRFFLQSHHGTYLNQGADGTTLQSSSMGGSELWAVSSTGATPAPTPTPTPAPIVRPAVTGRFYLGNGNNGAQVTVNPEGGVGTSTNKAAWEQFTISDAGGGKVYITSHHGTNLQMNDKTLGTSRNRGAWEQWTLTPSAGGKYLIIAHTGFQLGYSGTAYYCMHKNNGAWEQWTLTPC